MLETYEAEIFRQAGAESRSICVTVNPDLSVRMGAQDIGPSVKACWGSEDYEFSVDVPDVAISKLVFALLRDKYSGRFAAVDEFNEFCIKVGIEHIKTSWA